jgi:DNA topoisomerase-1
MSPEFLAELKTFVENTYGNYKGLRAKKATKAITQNGHECLRVTDPTMTPEKLATYITNDLQLKVYKIIWQRTIASVMANAVISETSYIINNNQQLFSLASNEVLSEGYRKIYNYKDEDSSDEILVKETFITDEELLDTNLEEVKKITTPPARYTEASLIKMLQKTGIGRPSTFATIVETVLSPTRGYAELDNKSIVPTDRGIQLSHFLDRSFSDIINLNYTKDMEKDLDLIATGQLNKLEFLNKFYENLENTIKNNTESTFNGSKIAEKLCPKCEAKMVIRRSRFGKLFYGCSNYPKCNGIVNME